ncbi:GNVR domain-containing protein [Acinetobacter sp. Lyrl_1]|uniref:GNVR domain-containing protein n=1 Tax=Acinetobacter sp. Lyrl_1 TaxID=3110920 RepID=UPI003F7C3CB7
MNPNTSLDTEDTIDLKELFFSLIEQWKTIILCILIALVSAFLYLTSTTPIYQTDALIEVKSNKSSPLAGLSSEMAAMASFAGLGGVGGSSIQSETELLKSRAIFGKAIQDLHLDIHFSPKINTLQKILSNDHFIKSYTTQGLSISLKNKNQNLSISEFKIPKFYENKELLLVFKNNTYTIFDNKTEQILKKGIVGQPLVDGTWSIHISGNLTSEQEFIIQKSSLPNAMSNILKKFNVSEKGKGSSILELTYQGENPENIPTILNSVLNIYKQQDITRSVIDKDQQVAFLEKQLPELKADLNNSERQFNQFREKYGTVDVKGESELYLKQSMELEIQKVQLQQKQAELGAQYTAEHPAMQAISAQLNALNTKINEVNNKVKQLPEIQRLYLQYYRDVEIKNQLYTGLLTTYQSLNVAKAGELGKVNIIDYAIEPTSPIKPKRLIVVVLSIFMGGFIGILIALLRNMFNSGLRNIVPIANQHHLKNLGRVIYSNQLDSTSKSFTPLLAASQPTAIAVEQMRQIATTLQHHAQNAAKPIVQMLGAHKNAGNSTLIANIAIVLAQMNLKVLLVDCDLKDGKLKQLFNISTSLGLSEYLNNSETILNSIVNPTSQTNLDLIHSGNFSGISATLLCSSKMTVLLNTVTSNYDLILIDNAAVLESSDGSILAKYVDTNILVTRFNSTTTEQIETALETFNNSGHNFQGVIFNMTKN